MHVLPKFGWLIEYNMRNIFLGKSYTKCCGESIPRPVPKNSDKFQTNFEHISRSLV